MSYNLILDTKFKPFTYQEMLAPVLAATTAHQALEEEYGKLATSANTVSAMANEQTDPNAYRMYQNYALDLEDQADQLLKYGLNATSRGNMMGMRSRYAKEILPIEVAYKRREKLAEEQRKAKSANPTALFQRDARTISLDELIKNPSMDYGEQYSGNTLYTLVKGAAANLAKEARDSENGKKKLRQLLPYQYEYIRRNGFSSDEVMAAIKNAPNANEILTNLVEDAVDASGIRNWNNAEALREAYRYARTGLYDAIGQSTSQIITDNAGLERYKMGLQRAQAAEDAKNTNLIHYRNNFTNLYSAAEVNSENERALQKMKRYQELGYISADGVLTNRGSKALYKGHFNGSKTEGAGTTGPDVRRSSNTVSSRTVEGQFYDWAVRNGLTSFTNANGGTSHDATELNKRMRHTMDLVNRGELASGVVNVQVGRTRVGSKDASDRVVELIASTNGNIISAGKLNNKGIIQEGDSMTAEDFRKKYTDKNAPRIVHLINSPVGDQQLVEFSDGSRYFIPSSVFGDGVVNPRTRKGDLDNMNAILRAEGANMGEEGTSDAAIGAFTYAQAYMASLLDYTNGSDLDYKGSTVDEEMRGY